MAVDWDRVVEHNREALKRILAMMVTMVAAGAAAVTRDVVTGEAARPTLPRHLYRAVLAILHPAESAARRLIVVAARGLSLPPPRLKPSMPKPRRRPSPTAIVFPHEARFPVSPPRAVPARIPLPMFDTLRPPARRLRSVPARLAPRITLPGLTVRHTLPAKPTPFDPIDATRLKLRLETLAAVLDDLPKEALRFARWRARSAARLGAMRARAAAAGQCPPSSPQAGYPAGHPAGHPAGRPTGRPTGRPAVRPTGRPGGKPAVRPILVGRLSPLRPGRAPGSRRRDRREVHEILANLQYFALEVLEPDTS